MMSRPPAPLGDDDHHTEALTHIDEFGQARMVNVTAKPVTRRIAIARCVVLTAADAPGVLERRRGGVDVIEAARFAGVQAAKQTASLIPLCHPLNLDRVSVQVEVESHVVAVSASTEIYDRTGVEMEALMACAITALALLNALTDVDPAASIEQLTLWSKSGGRSGDWKRTDVSEGNARPPRFAPPADSNSSR
jgi:cyclic pyranopterin monophosphate synthase